MKLRNKKTGEIKDWDFSNWYQAMLNPENKEKYECNLNDFIDRAVKFREEWCDYEEPSGWCISMYGGICRINKDDEILFNDLKEIGNYFNDKESAYDALDKLKAWKRLKDKGLKFNKWTIPEEPKTTHIKLVMEGEMDVPDSPYDLDLLFGGEE